MPPQYNLKTHLIRGASGSFLIKIIFTGLSLVTAVFLARILGAEDFGIYAFCLSVIQILQIPSMLGTQELLVREVAAYKVAGELGHIKGILYRSGQGIIIVSISLAGIAALISPVISERFSIIGLHTFWIALVLIPLWSLLLSASSALRGFNNIILSQIPGFIFRPSVFLVLILIGYMLGSQYIGPFIAMSMQVIAGFFSLILALYFLYQSLPEGFNHAAVQFATPTWIRSVGPFIWASGIKVLNKQISLILLGVMKDAKSVGIYQVAQRGAEFVIFGLTGVNSAIAPTLSEFYAQKDIRRLQRLVTKSSQAILAFALPAALILIIFDSQIISLVFGIEFASAASPLGVLCAGELINAAAGPVGLILNMTGNERTTACGVSIACIIDIMFCILLIPLFGVMGAAISSAMGLLIWNLILVIWLYNKTGILSIPIRTHFKN